MKYFLLFTLLLCSCKLHVKQDDQVIFIGITHETEIYETTKGTGLSVIPGSIPIGSGLYLRSSDKKVKKEIHWTIANFVCEKHHVRMSVYVTERDAARLTNNTNKVYHAIWIDSTNHKIDY